LMLAPRSALIMSRNDSISEVSPALMKIAPEPANSAGGHLG
jgi:hypothetical protein